MITKVREENPVLVPKRHGGEFLANRKGARAFAMFSRRMCAGPALTLARPATLRRVTVCEWSATRTASEATGRGSASTEYCKVYSIREYV